MGLGGNLGRPDDSIRHAIAAIDAFPDTRVVRASSLYRNPPMGPPEQPDYVNAVVELRTRLEPLALLGRLLALEDAHGRVRGRERWQARTLDLDLLLYGRRTMATPELTLPHPGAHLRPFVIHPLAEIAPQAEIPGHGTVAALAARTSNATLVRLNTR